MSACSVRRPEVFSTHTHRQPEQYSTSPNDAYENHAPGISRQLVAIVALSGCIHNRFFPVYRASSFYLCKIFAFADTASLVNQDYSATVVEDVQEKRKQLYC